MLNATDVRVYVWSYIYNPASAYQEDGNISFPIPCVRSLAVIISAEIL